MPTSDAISLDILLDSAAAQFARHGFDGVSMRDIGRDAGYTAPLICYHFENKQNLYLEAFSHKIDHTVDRIAARVELHADASARFQALVEALYDLFVSDHDLLALVQRDVLDATLGQHTLLSKRQLVHFTGMIRRCASEYTGAAIHSQTAFSVAALVFGHCQLASLRTVLGGDSVPEDAAADRAALVREAIHLVQGAAARR